MLLQKDGAASRKLPDDYHRSHLVERLAEFLLSTPENVRRIGILAEWGEGKTQLMKLLESRLRDISGNKFRMTWVNPWRSGSHDDAWVEIANGIDKALGFPRLLPRSLLAIPGLGSLLELLPKPLSGLTEDLKTLLTSEGSAADKIAKGLGEFLARRKQWLLVFVDDMERVSPEELRKILPVIDRLVEMDRCYFIFAIDPNRIAKAFGEDATHGDETKGYLDKILDFQMSLPAVSRTEVLEMLGNGIDRQACPKLYAALSSLRDYLPLNPRLAAKFLRDAEGRERMFLSRFGEQEESYEGFFLLLILETRYPTVHQHLRRHIKDFDDIGSLARSGFNGTDISEDAAYKSLLEEATKGLSGHDVSEAGKLIYRLIRLSSYTLIFDETRRSLDFQWAFEGYRKFIRFSAADRLAFADIWRARAGTESIESMLGKVGSYDEQELVVRETLKFELERIGGGFEQAYRLLRNGNDLDPIRFELDAAMKNFIDHATAIRLGKMQLLDRAVFNRELFDAWVDIAENKLMMGLPEEFVCRMRATRQRFMVSLAKLLPPADYRKWAKEDAWAKVQFGRSEAKRELEAEFTPVRTEILDDLTKDFMLLLENKNLTEETLPSWIEQSKIFDLIDPTIWLMNATDESQPALDSLVAKASSNSILRSNFATLITDAILAIYEDSPNDIVLAHSKARPCLKTFPWLLPKCWEGAWSGPLPLETENALITLRDKAIAKERDLIDRREEPSSILDMLMQLNPPDGRQTEVSAGTPNP